MHCTAILLSYIYISVDPVFSATSVFQTDKDRQLWDARTELNKLQREAIESGVKHSFQLIQGPPGIDSKNSLPFEVIDLLGQQFCYSSSLHRNRKKCYWSSSCIHIGQVE